MPMGPRPAAPLKVSAYRPASLFHFLGSARGDGAPIKLHQPAYLGRRNVSDIPVLTTNSAPCPKFLSPKRLELFSIDHCTVANIIQKLLQRLFLITAYVE